MKKYLITSAAALALCGLITSCTHELDYEASVQSSVAKKYEDAFVTAFGKPDPNQEWGFGSSIASSRGGTRAETFNFSLPHDYANNPGFKDKTNITKPGTIEKPTINKNGATVISGTSSFWNTRTNINSGETYYLESNSTLYLLSGYLQNVNIYMSEGSRLEVGGDLTLLGTTNIVNDGGTIDLEHRNFWGVKVYSDIDLNNLRGIFWNNGSITGLNNLKTSNDGGTIYNGSNGTITPRYNLSLNKDVELWNEGTITISGDFTTAACDGNGHRIYNSGTISTGKLSLNKNCTLWIEGGGSVTATGTFECINDNDKIYIGSGSTLSIKSLDLYNNYQLLVNEGTLAVEGDILARNTSAEIVNNGTMTGASLTLRAGAVFHNTADVTITGKTHIANSQSPWKNEGRYTTGDFEVSDYATMVYNNCNLTVHKAGDTGVFKIYGEFVVGGGGSIVADNVDWVNKSNVYLGNLSLFKVKKTFDSNNYDRDCGIHAMGNEWAVLQAKSIVQRNNVNDQFRMAYYGNLWIDAENHFDLWHKDTQSATPGDQPNYKFFGNAKFGHEGDIGCPVIPADNTNGCTPGYNDEHHELTPGVIRVIAEDLSVTQASDWDFNDVVFDVQLADNNTKVRITLLAAGGTLPLVIGDMDHEVHELFAAANPDKNISSSSMINTGSTGEKYTFINCKEATFYLDVKSEWFNDAGTGDDALVKAVAKNMPVQVYKLENDTKTWVTMECKKGEPAAKIAVGQDYNWCDERTDIRDKFKSTYANGQYSNFTLYVKGIIGDGWYNNTSINQEQADRY